MDGIILLNEVIHSLKLLKKPGMILKLDLSKAFDKLSWTSKHQMLLPFGLNATWTRWIMNLFSSLCFSNLLNGSPSTPFSHLAVSVKGIPFPLSFLFSW